MVTPLPPHSLLTSHLGKPSLSEEVGAKKHLLYEFELEDSDGYDQNEGEDDENEFQDEEET